MRIIRGAPETWRLAADAAGDRRRAVAIGNFDGVHRGHRALIAETARRGREYGLEPAVLTFDPHPRRVFQPEAEPFRLTSDARRASRLAELGVESLFVAPFEPALYRLSAEAFAETVLAEALNAGFVVTGSGFRFGAGRAGDPAMLAELGARLGFETAAFAPVGSGAEAFSSTAARRAIREGQPETAARILGAWHRVEGRVEKGDQRGRDLGFPTANLSLGDAVRPAFGVYAVRVEILDGPHAGWRDGVASIGLRPTFGAFAENFEVYIFDFSGDLYGAMISAELRRFLRPELKFDSVDALIVQMRADSEAARRALTDDTEPWR